MTIKLNRSLFNDYLLLIMIKLILEYGYINFVHKLYEYSGFNYEFILYKYILGWFVYLFGYYLLYTKIHIRIYYIYLLLFLIYVVPNIIYFSLSNQSTIYFIAIILPFFIITLMTINLKKFKLSFKFKYSKLFILILSIISIILVIVNYYISTGGRMVLNFNEVYFFRDNYGISSNQGIFGYLNSWVSKIFVIILLSWSIYKKKFFLILLLFALSGHKSTLKALFLVGFFYYLFNIAVMNKRQIILIGFLILIIFPIILSEVFDNNMVASLIIRRLLFIPSHLNFVYFEFFTNNYFIYWSNSILKSFIDYPYDIRMVEVIGNYLGKEGMAANTGFIASGFAQASYIGIIIYTFIGIIIFNIINHLSKNHDIYFIFAITFIPINALFISSDLFTVLLTHGLIISILVLWLYNNNKINLKIGTSKYEI